MLCLIFVLLLFNGFFLCFIFGGMLSVCIFLLVACGHVSHVLFSWLCVVFVSCFFVWGVVFFLYIGFYLRDVPFSCVFL